MPNLFGVKIGYLSLMMPEHQGGVRYVPAVVGGLFYERVVAHRWLEVELTVPLGTALAHEPMVFMPVDVHFKKPFHPASELSAYVGVGPTFDVVLAPESHLFFGVSSVVGAYLWFRRHVGIDIEVDYNVIREDGFWIHEIFVATGPVIRM